MMGQFMSLWSSSLYFRWAVALFVVGLYVNFK